MYEPLKVFTYAGASIVGLGVLGLLRYGYYALHHEAFKHNGSLIVSAVLLNVGVLVLMMGLLADTISGVRKLVEDLVYRVRSLESPQRDADEHRPHFTHTNDRADRWEH